MISSPYWLKPSVARLKNPATLWMLCWTRLLRPSSAYSFSYKLGLLFLLMVDGAVLFSPPICAIDDLFRARNESSGSLSFRSNAKSCGDDSLGASSMLANPPRSKCWLREMPKVGLRSAISTSSFSGNQAFTYATSMILFERFEAPESLLLAPLEDCFCTLTELVFSWLPDFI